MTIFLFIGNKQINAQVNNLTYKAFAIQGKYHPTPEIFHRVDTVKYGDMPKNVKQLFTNSAGLFITFKTDAKEVYGKWCVTGKKMNLNLTAIANKGLDVYIKNKEGKWQYANSKGTAKECEEIRLVENLVEGEKEFLVYLPIFDEIKSLEIGVPEGSSLEQSNNPFQKNIVVYGSSIVHGASAGRAGMTYPAIISRRTGLNLLNMGVSGNARMEKEVVHMLGDIPADVFVLDCVPNSSPQQVTERTAYLVEHLRSKHPNTPIIMIPSIIREQSYFNTAWGERNYLQNKNWKEEYQKLIQKGLKGLYYLDSNNLIGDDHEGTTDGVHPNDLGFMRMADQIQPFLLEVMKKHNLL